MNPRFAFPFLLLLAAAGTGLWWASSHRTGPAEVPLPSPTTAVSPPVAKPAPEPAKTAPAPAVVAQAAEAPAASKPAKPTKAERQARKQLARTAEIYAGLLAELKLPPDKEAAFIKLLTDRRQTTNDAVGAMVESGNDPAADPEAFRQTLLANRDDLEAQIKTLLGDENYIEYRTYSLTLGQQSTVQKVQSLLTNQAEPLSADQTAQLNAAMTRGGTGHITADVLQEAQAYLSPAQLAALAVIAEEQSSAAKRARAEKRVVTKGP